MQSYKQKYGFVCLGGEYGRGKDTRVDNQSSHRTISTTPSSGQATYADPDPSFIPAASLAAFGQRHRPYYGHPSFQL
jgi:hypothetical protein